MDANQDGLLNFREVVQLCDVLAKGDHSSKMRLLYCLHLPGMVLPGKLDSDDHNGGSADEQVPSQISFHSDTTSLGNVGQQIYLRFNVINAASKCL